MDEKEFTTLWVSKETKELFDRTITKDMNQDEGLKALLDFYIRYKGVVQA